MRVEDKASAKSYLRGLVGENYADIRDEGKTVVLVLPTKASMMTYEVARARGENPSESILQYEDVYKMVEVTVGDASNIRSRWELYRNNGGTWTLMK